MAEPLREYYYRGQPLFALSHDVLLEACRWAMTALDQARQDQADAIEMEILFAAATKELQTRRVTHG